MVGTARANSVFRPGSEFDDFLFAPVGEDGNGTLVSVLSALARLDLDPWQEAAKLARLSRVAASRRLAELIEALSLAPLAPLDAEAKVADLVALLPPLPKAAMPLPNSSFAFAITPRHMVLLFMFAFVILLGAQFVMAMHTPATDADKATPKSSSPSPSD